MTTTTYTPNSLSEIRYAVVQVSPSPPGPDLPAPEKVPEVAADKVPAQHRGPTSPEGDYQIVIRHESEDDPIPGAGADWIDHRQMRGHRQDNPDVWSSGESP